MVEEEGVILPTSKARSTALKSKTVLIVKLTIRIVNLKSIIIIENEGIEGFILRRFDLMSSYYFLDSNFPTAKSLAVGDVKSYPYSPSLILVSLRFQIPLGAAPSFSAISLLELSEQSQHGFVQCY